MLHVQIILLFMAVVLHDAWWGASIGSAGRASSRHAFAGGWEVLAAVGPMLVLAATTWLVLGNLSRDVERRGSWRAAVRSERVVSGSRWLAVLLHACNILVIGLLDVVRGGVGDLVALDELLVILLPLVVFATGWWAYYPIDRTLREAAMLRMLDQGRPVFPSPTRRQYVVMNFRHQVLLSLVPIALMAVWGEAVERGLRWAASARSIPASLSSRLSDPETLGLVYTALQIVGIAAVFTLSPLLLRRIWDTVRLGPGPLRARLAAICGGAGVRVRDLLVWRTHGSMINGAVIGLIAPLRYILLTDALLEHLPSRQIEAVMAHEVGHARHRHLPWLAVSMLLGMVGAAVVLSLAVAGLAELAELGGRPLPAVLFSTGLVDSTVALGTVVLGLVWFGFVSRRFEWQADAFAVQQLSLTPPAADEGPTLWDVQPPTGHPAGRAATVTPEAVSAMTGALDAVAELNHISRQSRSWRHGSIAYRQRRLRAIVGEPVDQLGIDRRVRWLKRGLALALATLIAALAWSRWG